jgi:hypothetical protein
MDRESWSALFIIVATILILAGMAHFITLLGGASP